MKHAFLILAHNLFEQLQLLINLLDDSRNDIYIHIDKKCKIPHLYAKYSKLNILKKRVDVRWGSVSLIKAELLLFETAYHYPENYSYYHLLSGVDLPIKNSDYLHNFFQNHLGKEFIGICDVDENEFIDRVNRIHLLRSQFRTNNRYISLLRYYLEKIINKIYKYPTEYIEYKKGPNWVSITNNFVLYLLENKTYILKKYKYSLCADEIYKQTLAWNSHFKKSLFYSDNTIKSCKRLIDWERGTPYIFGFELEKDINIIKNSDAIFARKFDLSKFPYIIRWIQSNI